MYVVSSFYVLFLCSSRKLIQLSSAQIILIKTKEQDGIKLATIVQKERKKKNPQILGICTPVSSKFKNVWNVHLREGCRSRFQT